MKSAILSAAELLESACTPFVARRHSEEPRLIILLVHSLYDHSSDPEHADIFPHESMTMNKLRIALERFLELGYTFVCPEEVLGTGGIPGKSVMLTFDDGYYNNVKALPLLREYAIPGTFFVCPGNIVQSRSFWWDAIYHHAHRRGAASSSVRRLIHQSKRLSCEEIDVLITEHWGKSAFETRSDLDRPLTLDELREFSREPFVHFGNHTYSHCALAFQSEADVIDEIVMAEEFFKLELGIETRVISYPNGDYADFVMSACQRLGYRLGMTIDTRWNPADAELGYFNALRLGRYMLSGHRNLRDQVDSINRKGSISAAIRRLSKHKPG